MQKKKSINFKGTGKSIIKTYENVVSSFYSEITFRSHTKENHCRERNNNNSISLDCSLLNEQKNNSIFMCTFLLLRRRRERIRRKNWEVTRKTENHKVGQ